MQNYFSDGYSLKDFLETKAVKFIFSNDDDMTVGNTEVGFVQITCLNTQALQFWAGVFRGETLSLLKFFPSFVRKWADWAPSSSVNCLTEWQVPFANNTRKTVNLL